MSQTDLCTTGRFSSKSSRFPNKSKAQMVEATQLHQKEDEQDVLDEELIPEDKKEVSKDSIINSNAKERKLSIGSPPNKLGSSVASFDQWKSLLHKLGKKENSKKEESKPHHRQSLSSSLYSIAKYKRSFHDETRHCQSSEKRTNCRKLSKASNESPKKSSLYSYKGKLTLPTVSKETTKQLIGESQSSSERPQKKRIGEKRVEILKKRLLQQPRMTTATSSAGNS